MKVVVKKGVGAGTAFWLHDGMNMLGRDVTNRIRLLDPRVSRRHCKIRKIGRSLFIYDLGTKNGTLVNGDPVSEQELAIGDQIKVGNTIVTIVDASYVPEKTVEQPGAFSFFRHMPFVFFGQRRGREVEKVDEDFAKFARKGRRPIWKPHVDTDPPEGRSKTVIPHTDPD